MLCGVVCTSIPSLCTKSTIPCTTLGDFKDPGTTVHDEVRIVKRCLAIGLPDKHQHAMFRKYTLLVGKGWNGISRDKGCVQACSIFSECLDDLFDCSLRLVNRGIQNEIWSAASWQRRYQVDGRLSGVDSNDPVSHCLGRLHARVTQPANANDGNDGVVGLLRWLDAVVDDTACAH